MGHGSSLDFVPVGDFAVFNIFHDVIEVFADLLGGFVGEALVKSPEHAEEFEVGIIHSANNIIGYL
jgi:hypothetical protein